MGYIVGAKFSNGTFWDNKKYLGKGKYTKITSLKDVALTMARWNNRKEPPMGFLVLPDTKDWFNNPLIKRN